MEICSKPIIFRFNIVWAALLLQFSLTHVRDSQDGMTVTIDDYALHPLL